jgi:hypothetical protein
MNYKEDIRRAGMGAMKQWMAHAYIGKSWRRNRGPLHAWEQMQVW